MIVYIDKEFLCHIDAGTGRMMVESEFFDGRCRSFIEGYRYIPNGSAWTRSDGKQFLGESMSPATNDRFILGQQKQYEEDLDNMMPLEDIAELIEEVYASDLEVIGE